MASPFTDFVILVNLSNILLRTLTVSKKYIN
jgi:hypothetical protein